MDVTVTHLQSTGIGRTVNILRKDDGDVGSIAKSLITKWKQMVASESSDHSEENRSENDQSLQEQEETVDSSQKSQQNHEHSSSKHKSGGHRDHSKHHSQTSNHREQKNLAEENGEKSTKKRRRSSRDSDRNGHKISSHHKVGRHRKTENNHDEHNDNKHHKRSNETDSVSSTSSSHKRHRENEPKQSCSSKRIKCDSTTSPSSQRNKAKKSSKSKSKPVDDGIEIDHSTGTSFADALGMIEPLPKTKSSLSSSNVNSHKSSNSKNISLSTSSSSSSSHDKSKPSTSSSNKSKTPTLLTIKANLPPLDEMNLLKDLQPQVESVIRNDYRPLPVNALIMDCVYRPINSKLSSANEAAALCASTTSKNQRTKVYSGTKTGQLLSVPSLHELCIRFLQKNIDALEYTGGVPFEILRPVLERATPSQLFTFEHFNPYLMEDSDVLWQQHCKNKFRAYKRQEMETWREMYARCEREQEERLASLANNIKKSISVAVPVRQTKLAYVNTAVKPPRGIVKKQNQFGTHAKLVATPAARVDALSSVATNIARVGDARLRTSAAIRDTAQVQPSNGSFKPKKAPLMMKTLQLMKGRFKR